MENMNTMRAISVLEGMEPCEDYEEIVEAWQFLINNGVCWQLQGQYGRAAMQMIEAGLCTLPEGKA